MKRVVFAFMVLVLASCGSNKNTVEIVTLNGEYQLLGLQGEDISDKGLSITFTPAEHRISGKTGCNGFSAKYTQENNVLSIGRAMSTRMFCEGKMELENKIFTTLEDIAKVEKKGNQIVLFSTDNTPLFTLNKN